MRLTRRPQGRQPRALPPTRWLIMVDGLRWEGDSLTDLHKWLVTNRPQPGSKVGIWRNNRHIYDGTWHDLADAATLW